MSTRADEEDGTQQDTKVDEGEEDDQQERTHPEVEGERERTAPRRV